MCVVVQMMKTHQSRLSSSPPTASTSWLAHLITLSNSGTTAEPRCHSLSLICLSLPLFLLHLTLSLSLPCPFSLPLPSLPTPQLLPILSLSLPPHFPYLCTYCHCLFDFTSHLPLPLLSLSLSLSLSLVCVKHLHFDEWYIQNEEWCRPMIKLPR